MEKHNSVWHVCLEQAFFKRVLGTQFGSLEPEKSGPYKSKLGSQHFP